MRGAALRIEGEPTPFVAGDTTADNVSADAVSVVRLNAESRQDILELYGRLPSGEVRNALASMLSLVIERARSSEVRARIEATQRGEDSRSTVLNALAHNFKTPLTSIKAAASALRVSGEIPCAGERELVAIIDEEADRLDQLIGESLNLARIEGRRANPRTEECFFPEIIENVQERLDAISVAASYPSMFRKIFRQLWAISFSSSKCSSRLWTMPGSIHAPVRTSTYRPENPAIAYF